MLRVRLTKVASLPGAPASVFPIGMTRTGTLSEQPRLNTPVCLMDCDETKLGYFCTSEIKGISYFEGDTKYEFEEGTLDIFVHRELELVTLNSIYKLELLYKK